MYNVRVFEYPTGYQYRIYSDVLGMPREETPEVRTGSYSWIPEPEEEGVTYEPDVWHTLPDVPYFFDEEYQRWEQWKEDECSRVALCRAKQNLYHIARSNVWEWFLTLTLNKEKIERFDYDVIAKKVRKWFNNLKRKAPGLYYVIVPEHHKNGAWHFHGLIGGCEGLVFDFSGRRDKKGRPVYNLPDWGYGWSTATEVSSTDCVSAYVCKYITKDFIGVTKGRKRYWVSNNCNRAECKELVLEKWDIQKLRKELYEKCTFKKVVQTEYLDVEYWEVPK